MVTLNGRGTRSAPGRGARPDSAENPLETRLHLDPLTLVPSQPLEGFLVGAERAGQPRGQRRTLLLELLVMRQERRQPFLQDFQRLPALSGQHRKRCGRTLVAASSRCQEIAPAAVRAGVSGSKRASTNSPGSNGRRSSMASPTPTYRTGRSSSCRTAITTPPRAVPSSLVSTTVLRGAAWRSEEHTSELQSL